MQTAETAVSIVDQFLSAEQGERQLFRPEWFTGTGLTLPDDLSDDHLLAMADPIGRLARTSMWVVGDYMVHVERHFGEDLIAHVYELTGLDFQTLRNAYRVSRKFADHALRRASLDFGHHKEVAARDDWSEWLDRAETAEPKRWSVADLRKAIKDEEYFQAQQEVIRQSNPDVAEPAIIFQDEAASFLEGVAPQTVDLLITDPPYMTDLADIQAFVHEWVCLALQTVKPAGRAYICTGAYPEELHAYLGVLLAQPFLKMQQVLVWTYGNTMGPSPTHNYKLNWQAVFYLTGDDAAPINSPVMLEQLAVHDIPHPARTSNGAQHEWQKPTELAERLIRHSTKPGDMVIDPFAGTGEFLHTAARLGRRAIGSEIDPQMIAICESRGIEVRRA